MSMIAAFYGGKSILITGATGFLGKVLMEKLFRTSPDLKVIYVLVRPKQGQTLQQRVFQILDSKVCLMGSILGDGDSLQYSLIAPDADGTQNIWADRGEETKQESNQQFFQQDFQTFWLMVQTASPLVWQHQFRHTT